MEPKKFIRKHITSMLVAEGFSLFVGEWGKRGLEYFRQMSQPSKKGGTVTA